MTELLEDRQGPAIAATNYVRAYADQIRALVPMAYTVLGTDGFGRSDTRAKLRRHFEVDHYYIAHAANAALAKEGKMTAKDVSRDQAVQDRCGRRTRLGFKERRAQ